VAWWQCGQLEEWKSANMIAKRLHRGNMMKSELKEMTPEKKKAA
jgi:hypothetical protein